MEEPIGFDGVILSKELSSTYFGFMGLGYLASLSDHSATMTSRDEVVIGIIKSEIALNGYLAKIPYELRWCGELVFTGIVDIESYEEDCCEVKFSVRSTSDDKFISRRNTTYAIAPTMDCLLTGKFLSGKSTHALNDTIATYQSAGDTTLKSYKHYIPFKYVDNTITNGKANTITNVTVETAVFENTSGQDFNTKITGLISFLWTANPTSSCSVMLMIKDSSGNILKDILQATVTSNAGFTLNISINYSGKIPAGAKFYVYVKPVSNAKGWIFKYSWASLTIEDATTNTLIPSTHKGILLSDLFEQLRLKMGVSVPLCSDWLDTCGKNYFITNGYQLRGIDRPINTDFEWLFTHINKMFCLGAELTNDCLRIEQRGKLASCINPIDLGEVTGTLKINGEFLYSTIIVGYLKWQSDTVYGNDEFNANHTYQTDMVSKSNTLSLQSELIASGYLIEKLRRQSLDPNALKQQDNELDDRLFIISVLPNGKDYKAETNEFFTEVTGIISPETAYNLRISPKRNLMNWQKFWAGLGNLTLTANQGNEGLVSTLNNVNSCDIGGYVKESETIQGDSKNAFSFRIISIEQDEDPTYYNLIDKCIMFSHCGKDYTALAKKVELKPSAIGGKIIIDAWILS